MSSDDEYLEQVIEHNRKFASPSNVRVQRYANIVTINPRLLPDRSNLAFHAGPANQHMLVASNIEPDIKQSLGHVFFSTSVQGLRSYFDFDPTQMVYFADMSRVSNARVQLFYKHKVVFQDELVDAASDFRSGKISDIKLAEIISGWINKYTIPYNPLRHTSNNRYVLLKEPIKVLYDQ